MRKPKFSKGAAFLERQIGLRPRTLCLGLFLGGLLASIFLVVFLNAPSHLTLPSKVPLQTETGSVTKERMEPSNKESLSTTTNSTVRQEIAETSTQQSPSTTTSSLLSKSEEQKEAIEAANRYANQVAQSIASSERQAGAEVHFSQK